MPYVIDNDLNHAASRLIKRQRQVLGWAQDRLAEECGLDRTYISAIERHRSNLSLTAVSKLLAALGLTIAISPTKSGVGCRMSELFPRTQYLENPQAAALAAAREATFSSALVLDAIDDAHAILDQFVKFEVDVFAILGMRNLSAFIGELFAAAMIKVGAGLFRNNPHQDGYPDLLVMDEHGLKLCRVTVTVS